MYCNTDSFSFYRVLSSRGLSFQTCNVTNTKRELEIFNIFKSGKASEIPDRKREAKDVEKL